MFSTVASLVFMCFENITINDVFQFCDCICSKQILIKHKKEHLDISHFPSCYTARMHHMFRFYSKSNEFEMWTATLICSMLNIKKDAVVMTLDHLFTSLLFSSACDSLLKLVSVFVRCHGITGSVYVNGKPRNMVQFRRMSRYIMQEDHLQPWLTVWELMELALDLKIGHTMERHEKHQTVKDRFSFSPRVFPLFIFQISELCLRFIDVLNKLSTCTVNY